VRGQREDGEREPEQAERPAKPARKMHGVERASLAAA
jgi:hypothetical protein